MRQRNHVHNSPDTVSAKITPNAFDRLEIKETMPSLGYATLWKLDKPFNSLTFPANYCNCNRPCSLHNTQLYLIIFALKMKIFETWFVWNDKWRHNGLDGVLNHQRLDCLVNRLFRRKPNWHQSSTCKGNSPMTCKFPAQRATEMFPCHEDFSRRFTGVFYARRTIQAFPKRAITSLESCDHYFIIC